MKKTIGFILAGLLTAILGLAPTVGIAEDKPKTPAVGNAPEKPAQTNVRPAPFRGTVASVDKKAKTVTVGERTFHVSAETRVFNGNRPGTLDEMKVGDLITGNYLKGDDGKLTAKMIRFGTRPKLEETPEQKAKAPDKKNNNAAE